MKTILLAFVVASFALGAVGCMTNENPDSTAGDATRGAVAGLPKPIPNPNKAKGPDPSKGPMPQLSANANDPRWRPGTMLRSSSGK